jgi:hypothetical protein
MMTLFVPSRIVSGGQTGVDRGALEAAIALDVDHGGWCPDGRLSEDGSIPSRYRVQVLDGADYAARTEQNIIDSDATLILYQSRMEGGTRLTRRLVGTHRKPWLAARIDHTFDPEPVRKWLREIQPATLNVAGPRESKYPGIEQRSMRALLEILTTPG